jgi:hypothetical protein
MPGPDAADARHALCTAGACKAGLLWKPDEGAGGVTNLWIADVKAVREAHADMLKGLPLGEAWLRCWF